MAGPAAGGAVIGMVWPAWLSLATPMKFSLWLANRIATWTGLFYFWKRFRSQRHFWVWLALINVVSLGGLCLVLFWLHVRAVR